MQRVARVGIHVSQIGRPESLADISHVTEDRVAQPQPERIGLITLVLRKAGDDGVPGGDHKEERLLLYQFPESAQVLSKLGTSPKPAERPVVPQEQDERKRD